MFAIDKHKMSTHEKLKHRTILDIQDLNVRYGKKKAVDNVSMAIAEKAVTALIGPSGCGKSTFLRTINRMNDLIPGATCEGAVYYQDRDLLQAHIDVVQLRKEIGMLFQRPNPFPKSIFDNVAHGLKCAGIKNKTRIRETVEESLKFAGLWDEVKDRLKNSALGLSGGQQQRLCLARALALKPEILLLDEPASALDPVSTARIEELILSLKTSHTIVIVTHNMQQAARIADQTAFFYQGRLIEYRQTLDLFTRPAEEKTEAYITGRFG
ncbi:phosphate ABC transporter ATP-binding protein PstB [Camelliibacillus cellulosilyticus]|uniref:Phosphate ABC transporter ATP-binding protein PstB n=1 Tax=Camelliibacillus cellulosilyticus TaxID=2174486 RepID=A0ABV9GHH1_9BACL